MQKKVYDACLMSLPVIYQTLSDATRLRILHLLATSPLCVQHLQIALGANQVLVSKHLLLLKANGLVESEKIRNWRLYRLPPKPVASIRRNLDCLLACIHDEQLFQEDLKRLQPLRSQIQQLIKPAPKPTKHARSAKPARSTVPTVVITPPPPPTQEALEDHLL